MLQFIARNSTNDEMIDFSNVLTFGVFHIVVSNVWTENAKR